MGKLRLFSSTKNIYCSLPLEFSFSCDYRYLTTRGGGWRHATADPSSRTPGRGRPCAIFSANTLRKKALERIEENRKERLWVLLIILVTGNRKGGRGLPPPIHKSLSQGPWPSAGALARPGVGERMSCPQSGRAQGPGPCGGRGHPAQASVYGASASCAFYPSSLLEHQRPEHCISSGRGHDPHMGPTGTKQKVTSDKQASATHIFSSLVFRISHHSITC